MQKFYELVVLIHPQTSKEELTALHTKLDSLLGEGKKQVDDMGLMQLSHPIGKSRLTQAHMISYHCELKTSKIVSIKKELALTKGVVRYVFFAMGATDPFFTYAEVNKKFEKLLEEQEEKNEKADGVGTFPDFCVFHDRAGGGRFAQAHDGQRQADSGAGRQLPADGLQQRKGRNRGLRHRSGDGGLRAAGRGAGASAD